MRALTIPRPPRPSRADGLSGPGATMLSAAIFGGSATPLGQKLARLGYRLREIALAMTLAAVALMVVVGVRILAAARSLPELHDWLHGWLPFLI